MDSVELSSTGDSIEDMNVEASKRSYGVFGEPEMVPRVGNEYQVQIPDLVPESDVWRRKNPTGEGIVKGHTHDFLIGLALPIMWIQERSKKDKDEQREHIGDIGDMPMKNEYVRREGFLAGGHGLRNEAQPDERKMEIRTEPVLFGNIASTDQIGNHVHEKERCGRHFPVPGTVYDFLSDKEKSSFLLGLYIFGKNFIYLKRFVETKKMSDILSYYYGKFYRSERYRKWAEGWKLKSRKCVYGDKMFTGLRQQELLSRLLPLVSEEIRNKLLEVSKTFSVGNISFEEYVFILKDTIGIDNLVESIGIGKGRRDLTCAESLRSSQVIPVHPEIPTGKAWSKLSTAEIVNFLRGSFRLSKARSNDLFWEAVWPRLLARGWHSEQPSINCGAGSKHSLVFLTPGVKKFSRSKLVKGNHYFDSISDVLGIVASRPELLNLEIKVEGKCEGNEEMTSSDEMYSDQEDPPRKERYCYLKPRTPVYALDAMKFTVIDTSMADGIIHKYREVRGIPIETIRSADRIYCEEGHKNVITKLTSVHGSGDCLSFNMAETDISEVLNLGKKLEDKSLGDSESSPGLKNSDQVSSNISVKVPSGQSSCISHDIPVVRAIKLKSKTRKRTEGKSCFSSTVKRCGKGQPYGSSMTGYNANILVHVKPENEEPSYGSATANCSDGVHRQPDPPQEMFSSNNISQTVNPVSIGEAIFGSSSFVMDVDSANEEPHKGMLIDLNLPVAPDGDIQEREVMEITEMQYNQSINQCNDLGKTNIEAANSEQQSSMNCRRHSTRNRPPTTKALEALALGFLETKRKRKARDYTGQEEMPRPSPHVGSRSWVADNCGTNIMDFKTEEKGIDGC